jgi:AraC family transcriptional regulator
MVRSTSKVPSNMLERDWLLCAQTSQMQFAVRASSEKRAWTGFDATLCDATGGMAEVAHSPSHNLTIHVGAPVTATCSCDGPVQRRVQIPGDMDLVPAGYRAIWEDSEPTSLLIINISPLLVRSTAESMGINPDTTSLSPRLQLRDPMLQHVAWALKAELETEDPHDRLYAESLGTALTSQLLRRYARRSMPKRGLSRRQWHAVIDFINGNLALNLSLTELAAVAGLGPTTFKLLFKQSVGMPVHQYVIRRRVEHAANLLSNGTTQLREVALKAGFFDQSHMARCFRRVLGVTPAAVTRESRTAN